MAKPAFDKLQNDTTTLDEAIKTGQINVEGSRDAANQLFGMVETFPFWFNIVTP